MTPELRARTKIDQQLVEAGWLVQHKDEFNRNAGVGVAVREFSLPPGPCDYLLFVGGKAAGVIEAKPAGTTLSGVAEQAGKYMERLPEHLARWADTLLFDYESTGEETLFRDVRDPDARSRRLFTVHRPETLLRWAQAGDTLRLRLRQMPPLDTAGLRLCQVEAISGTQAMSGLERSLARGDPRALIQMATGAGKTFTACTFCYRLVKHAGAQRILFLVDRNNLGDQALKEFQQYRPPDDTRHFSDLYITQHLKTNRIDPDAKVVITTIQRLYAMLRGEELPPDAEETSLFEQPPEEEGPPREVVYNPRVPIETFDFIITDECHRSIYGQWRQVLDYFDAFVIGLTATPSKHTLGFFNRNLVAEYPYERSVIDGVNVPYEIYRIKTKIGEHGSTVDAGYEMPVMDKRTRRRRYDQLDADLQYTAQELDRSVTAPNMIRTVLEAYREHLFTDLFPGRDWVPKTLIFAKDDAHAESIVEIAREVFGKGNEFVKKITYRVSEDPKGLVKAFRVDPLPRIVVTVDMIATGTDVRPIEVLIFLRDVKSELYYEQMKGRGVRSINPSDLKQVTPDAEAKTRFVLVDAVGVSESQKTAVQPLERKRNVGFEKLLDQVAAGLRDDDSLSSLAGRLAALDHRIGDEDRGRIKEASGGVSLHDVAAGLLDAIDPDRIEQEVERTYGTQATDEQRDEVRAQLKDEACASLDQAPLRNVLKEIKRKSEIVIDDISRDELRHVGYDFERARETTRRFRDFIEANKDELLALQILYSRPYKEKRLTYAAIQELADKLTNPPWHLTTAVVWEAYRRLEADKVRGASTQRLLTDIIALVRFATGQAEILEPFSAQVEQRFNLWVGRQIRAGREFTDEQMNWLHLVKAHIAANAEVAPRDLMEIPTFTDKGGLVRARVLFGEQLNPILDGLNEALVA